jgi:glucokinase
VLSSEGGHIGLFPWNDEVYELIKFVKKEKGLVDGEIESAEHFFCGLGIPYIYRFYSSVHRPDQAVNPDILGEEVVKLAFEGDEIGAKTLVMFIEILAAVLQHLCASLTPETGILLSGSILASIKDYFIKELADENSKFFKVFYNNKSLKNFLKSIPIYLCVKDELGMFGCMVSAIHKLITSNCLTRVTPCKTSNSRTKSYFKFSKMKILTD